MIELSLHYQWGQMLSAEAIRDPAGVHQAVAAPRSILSLTARKLDLAGNDKRRLAIDEMDFLLVGGSA